MIITKTPFRISFFGGGTDYPAWYNSNGGAVLSVTIDKYCYITCRFLPPFFKHKHRIVYSKSEEISNINKIRHPSVRETVKLLKINRGLEIHHDGDLPARSGLGSSSSFTVGLLNALHGLEGRIKTKRELALDAIHIEQKRIKENVGSQDQVAAAFGSFNKIEFGGVKNISVQPIIINPEKLDLLQDHVMLFFTGFTRYASNIAKEQIKNMKNKEIELRAMREMVDESINILNSNRDINEFGKLLNESWKLKRSLSSKITNGAIDHIYSTAIKAGATGGKLLGAGGGGFIIFFVRPRYQKKVKEKLKKMLHVPFRFEHQGSQIIYYSHQNNF